MKLITKIFRRNDWYITSKFGWRNCFFHGKEFHCGIDYGTNCEKWKIYAIEDGYVQLIHKGNNGYGNYIWIRYPRLNISLMHAHLDKICVKKGQKVKEGTLIGYTNAIKTGVTATSIGSVGALSVGAGVASSVVGNVGGNKLLSEAGKLVSNYGNNIRNNTDNSTTKKVGNIVTKLGDKIQEKPFSKIGNTLRSDGYRKIERAFNSVTPYNMNYRNRRK